MVQETRRLHGMDMSVSKSTLLAISKALESSQGSSSFFLLKKIRLFILCNIDKYTDLVHNFLVFTLGKRKG